MSSTPQRADSALLRILKGESGAFVSGQSISVELGVSRSAVWKHISNLRRMGYQVEAVRSKGYRLPVEALKALPFNEVEIASEVGAGVIGSTVHFFEELKSTNVKALELAAAGAGEGTCVVADSQLGGKGRLGRSWYSPKGVNLYTSVILRPEIKPADAPALTLLFAVAAAEAIEAFVSPVRPVVKWPNDILIGREKAVGILTEMSSEMERVNYIVAGFGVNLNMDTTGLKNFDRGPAVSLKEVSPEPGEDISRAGFAAKLYGRVEEWYDIFKKDGIKPVVAGWRSYFDAVGKEITVDTIDRTVTGVCAGIDESGALLVRESSGKVATVTSGDMSICGAPGRPACS